MEMREIQEIQETQEIQEMELLVLMLEIVAVVEMVEPVVLVAVVVARATLVIKVMVVLVVVTILILTTWRREEMVEMVATPAVVLDKEVDMVVEEDLEIIVGPTASVMVEMVFIMVEMVVRVEEVVLEQIWQEEDIMVALAELVVMALTAAVEAAAVKVGMETQFMEVQEIQEISEILDQGTMLVLQQTLDRSIPFL